MSQFNRMDNPEWGISYHCCPIGGLDHSKWYQSQQAGWDVRVQCPALRGYKFVAYWRCDKCKLCGFTAYNEPGKPLDTWAAKSPDLLEGGWVKWR